MAQNRLNRLKYLKIFTWSNPHWQWCSSQQVDVGENEISRIFLVDKNFETLIEKLGEVSNLICPNVFEQNLDRQNDDRRKEEKITVDENSWKNSTKNYKL